MAFDVKSSTCLAEQILSVPRCAVRKFPEKCSSQFSPTCKASNTSSHACIFAGAARHIPISAEFSQGAEDPVQAVEVRSRQLSTFNANSAWGAERGAPQLIPDGRAACMP